MLASSRVSTPEDGVGVLLWSTPRRRAGTVRGSVTQQSSGLPGLPGFAVERVERLEKPKRASRRANGRHRAAPEERRGLWAGLAHRVRVVRRDPQSVLALAIALLGLVGAVTVGVARDALLPAKFSYDARFIQTLARTGRLDSVDRSFSNTAGLYRLLGLQDSPVVVALITVAILAVITGFGLNLRRDGRVPVMAGLLGAVALLLGGVYLGTYSKDAPVLAVAAALLVLGRGWRSELGILLVVAGYAWIFRSYWFLVLAVFVGLRLLHRFRPRWWMWLAGAVGAVVVVSLGIALVLHLPPDYFRSAVNVGRTNDADAQTMMRPLLSDPQPLAGIVSVVVTFFTLFVPVPLLQMGGLYYVAVFALVVAIWACFWWTVIRAGRSNVDPAWSRAVAFLIAFVAVQAFFEPDYGSALRHLTPLLPVLVFVVGAAKRAGSRVPSVARQGTEELRRNAPVDTVGSAITGDHGAGGDHAPLADRDAGQDRRSSADPDAVADRHGRSERRARAR